MTHVSQTWLLSVFILQAGCREETPRSAHPVLSTRIASLQHAPPVENQKPEISSVPTRPRIYAKARFTWIHPTPGAKSWIGYMTLGQSVTLRGDSEDVARVYATNGCEKLYAVEPQGYVCADSTATLDPNDPTLVDLQQDTPNIDSPWPYQYGESIGTPRYANIPTLDEQRSTEWDFESHIANVQKARTLSPEEVASVHAFLAGVDLSPAGSSMTQLADYGPFIRDAQRKSVVRGSTIAYTRQFDANGRAFLVTSDRAVVPKDRVKPYKKSAFHGVDLQNISLPIAFFRDHDTNKFVLQNETIHQSNAQWKKHDWVQLTGQEKTIEGQRYLETKEPQTYVSMGDVTVVKSTIQEPYTAAEKNQFTDRRTWIEVSVLGGWLIAYENQTPIFATLISAGRGGVPRPGVNPIETASTPTGTFRIDGKFRTATMVSSTNENIVHAEVQFTQNFHGPHALHAAYWHDDWGNLKSGGCINLSPLDAKKIFEWTEPKIPEGWHGMRSLKEFGPATRLVVHR